MAINFWLQVFYLPNDCHHKWAMFGGASTQENSSLKQLSHRLLFCRSG